MREVQAALPPRKSLSGGAALITPNGSIDIDKSPKTPSPQDKVLDNIQG